MPATGSRPFNGWTVLALQNPNCVIVIPDPNLLDAFEGKFTNCLFFHDEQLTPPVTFVCAAWCQCLWTYRGHESLRRRVEVTGSGDGSFTVNITAVKDKDENDEVDSTGYVFHLDVEGKTADQVICALKRRHMFFSRPWIERFCPSISSTLSTLNHPDMVEEFLRYQSGNDGLVKLLSGIVTDQDFRRQHGMLLKCIYDDFEAAVLSKPMVEVRKGTGDLSVMHSLPPLMRDSNPFSSSSRSDEGAIAHSLSLSSTDPEKVLVEAQTGLESFDHPDSSTTIAANVDFVVESVARSGPDSSLHEPEAGAVENAMADSEENWTGSSKVFASESDKKVAFYRDFHAVVAKYGIDMIEEGVREYKGHVPEVLDSPLPPTCVPVQRQYSGPQLEPHSTETPYAPQETTVGSDEDQVSPDTPGSDTYRS